MPLSQITVATSEDATDDPIDAHARGMAISVFRGPLADVFQRFRLCLDAYPCDWFLRVCADSPLLCPDLLRIALSHADRALDLVTNVQKRTFPTGHSVEIVNAGTFLAIDPGRLSADEREHATKLFYNHPLEFRILNIENEDVEYAAMKLSVDTLDDLRRLESMVCPQGDDTLGKLRITGSSV